MRTMPAPVRRSRPAHVVDARYLTVVPALPRRASRLRRVVTSKRTGLAAAILMPWTVGGALLYLWPAWTIGGIVALFALAYLARRTPGHQTMTVTQTVIIRNGRRRR